ncbi:MAG: transglutaminase-like domain-containing protein, partial [Candidatus Ranarchaeia archaeon]
RFTFEITDEYYIWDNYDPNAVLTGIPSDILEIWTRNESNYNVNEIEVNSSYFRNIVNQILNGSENLDEKIQKMYEYTIRNIAYSLNNPEGGSRSVLESRRGNCHAYSIVLISLLRSCGIPAREGAGIGIQKNGEKYQHGYHGWVEIYYPNYGWVPVDPTWVDTTYVDLGVTDPVPISWGESFQIAGSHIRLTTSLQANGSVWFSVGSQTDYLGSPYPEELLQLEYYNQDIFLPEINRGVTISASSL